MKRIPTTPEEIYAAEQQSDQDTTEWYGIDPADWDVDECCMDADCNCPYEDTDTSDMVYKPAHYAQWEIEPIEFIVRNNLPFSVGNAIKYLVRSSGDSPKVYDGLSERESRVTDLEKAKRYIDIQINHLNNEEEL